MALGEWQPEFSFRPFTEQYTHVTVSALVYRLLPPSRVSAFDICETCCYVLNSNGVIIVLQKY